MKAELLTASACPEYASYETNKIHVYKLTGYLMLLGKSPPLQ